MYIFLINNKKNKEILLRLTCKGIFFVLLQLILKIN